MDPRSKNPAFSTPWLHLSCENERVVFHSEARARIALAEIEAVKLGPLSGMVLPNQRRWSVEIDHALVELEQ